MSGDLVDFQSKLEDLESFVELLSPIGAHSQETIVVDSAWHINFDEPQELVISEMRVHTKNSMMTMQGTINQLKDFFVDSSPISEFDFAKNQVIIPKNKQWTKGSKESNAYALAMTALSPKLGAAKHFVTKSEDGEADPGNVNDSNIQEQVVGNYSKLRMLKSILLVMIL
jgi:Cu2+-containing amine oxidase